MKLSDISADVLAQILNGDLSFASILLWKTGDRRIQSLLRNGGIRDVVLVDHNPLISLDWPSCLKEFSLHSLSVTRDCRFKSISQVRHEMKQLRGEHLFRLELAFPGAFHVINRGLNNPPTTPTPSYFYCYDEDNDESGDDEGSTKSSPYVVVEAEDGETVGDMASRLGMEIEKGKAYYRLSKAEDVSSEKLLVLRKLYDGSLDDDIDSIRAQVGIDGTSKKSKVKPNMIPDGFELFVQSTSPNRKLPSGPIVVHVGSSATNGSDDNNDKDDIPVAKRSSSKKRGHKYEEEVEQEETVESSSSSVLTGTTTSKRMKLHEDTTEGDDTDITLGTILPHLKHLSLKAPSIRFEPHMYSKLPSTLLSLRIDGVEEEVGSATPDFGKTFPHLVELEISPIKLSSFDVATLPSTLTRINKCYEPVVESQLVSHLPSLVHLHLTSLPTSLPPSLTSLELENAVDGLALQSMLPSTLTHLKADNLEMSSVVLSLWPSSLTSFVVASVRLEHYPLLPRALTSLTIGDDSESYYQIDYEFEYSDDEGSDDGGGNEDASGDDDGGGSVADESSDGAEREKIGRDILNTIDAERWTVIKAQLVMDAEKNGNRTWTTRYITQVEKGQLYGLPLGLNRLDASKAVGGAYKTSWLLPPLVKHVTLMLSHTMRVGLTFWELLPPSLTHLGIEDYTMDEEGEPGILWKLLRGSDPTQSPLYQHSGLRSMSFPGRRAHTEGPEDNEHLLKHPFTAYLPRGLNSLHLWLRDMDVGDWLKSLPPNLETLLINLQYGNYDPDDDWISYLPRNIKHLKFGVGNRTASDIPLLPPNLETLSCNLAIEEFSIDDLRNLPSSLRYLNNFDRRHISTLFDWANFACAGPYCRMKQLDAATLNRLLHVEDLC